MAFLTSEGAEYLFKKLSDAKNIKITGNSNGSRVSDVVNSIVNKADNITKAISKEVANTSKMFKVGTGNVDVSSDVEDGFSEVGIKGVTYQNLLHTNKVIEFTSTSDYDGWDAVTISGVTLLKPNTKYTIIVNVLKFNGTGTYNINQGPWGECFFDVNMPVKSTGIKKFVATTVSNLDDKRFILRCQNNDSRAEIKITDFMIFEGDVSNIPDIPSYFEGIKGVGEKNKNLFNINNVSLDKFLLGNVGVGYGDCYQSAVSNISDYIPVVAGRSYVFSYEYTQLLSTVQRAYCFYNKNKEIITSNNDTLYNPTSKTLVLTPGVDGYVRICYDKKLINIQLEEGVTQTSYDTHHKGYKIEIESTGKNLYKIHNDKTLTYGVSKIEDGMITTNVLSSYAIFGLTNSLYNISDKIFINPTKMIKGKKYSIKCKVRKVSGEGNLNYFALFGFNKGKSSYSNTGVSKNFSNIDLSNEWLEIGFSGVATDDFDAVCPGFQAPNYVNNLVLQIKDIQIEESDNPTSYEHFKSDKIRFLLDEPLMRLPNGVCDEITEDGKLIRRVGKVVLNGGEKWEYNTGVNVDNYSPFYTRIDGKLRTTNLDKFISDRFVVKSSLFYDREAMWDELNNTVIYVKVLNSKLQTLSIEGFKKWLAQNPITVYYQLETPIITQLNTQHIRLFKAGYIKTNTFITPETTHVVQLNKSAQIERTVKEVQSLDNKVGKLEGLYDELLLSTSQSLDLLCLDFDLREDDE